MDGVQIGVITLLIIAMGMAVIAVRMFVKLRSWQVAWLLFVCTWTVHPGFLSIRALIEEVSLWIQGHSPGAEDFGWILIGLTMWVVPIASLYLLGTGVSWFLQRKKG